MRKVSCYIALLLLLSLSVTGAAFAQGTLPVYCGDLEQADCDILTNAQEATATLDSALYNFSFTMNIAGIPEAPAPISFALTGSGAVSGMAGLQSMYADPAALQELMMADPGQFFEDALGGFNGDLNLTLTLPPELVASMGAGIPDSITLQIRLVEGFGYLNLDTLIPIVGEDALPMSGWVGIDLISLVQAAMEQMPSDFDMSMGGMSTTDMAAFYDPEFLNSFGSIERIDDGTGDTAVFAYDIDFAAMFASEQFQDLMRQQMDAMDTTLSDEEMQEALAMTAEMFQDVTFTMTQEIGLEDGYIHSMGGVMNFDMASMMESMGESTSGPAPTIDVAFNMSYSGFNSAPQITAPEPATIIPYEALLGSGMNSMDMDSGTGSVAGSSDGEDAAAEPPMAAEMTPTATPAG